MSNTDYKLRNFLKESFCIDGDISLGQRCKVIMEDGHNIEGVIFTLSDSKRGRFTVVVSKDTIDQTD